MYSNIAVHVFLVWYIKCRLLDPYVTCEEVQTLLCQNGMFDEALKLSMSCNLSLVPVYESLAAKYVTLDILLVYY